MNPKEKAIQLITLFTLSCKEFDNAKLSALKAVDELIVDNEHNEKVVNGGLNKQYWQEVKKEIEAL